MEKEIAWEFLELEDGAWSWVKLEPGGPHMPEQTWPGLIECVLAASKQGFDANVGDYVVRHHSQWKIDDQPPVTRRMHRGG